MQTTCFVTLKKEKYDTYKEVVSQRCYVRLSIIPKDEITAMHLCEERARSTLTTMNAKLFVNAHSIKFVITNYGQSARDAGR